MNNRPVNLDLTSIRMPVTAISSITHRITGILLFLGSPILLWMLEQCLASPESYQYIQSLLAKPWFALMYCGILVSLLYHIIAGVRHLLMDWGIGESKAGGEAGAKLVLLLTAVIVVALGVWL